MPELNRLCREYRPVLERWKRQQCPSPWHFLTTGFTTGYGYIPASAAAPPAGAPVDRHAYYTEAYATPLHATLANHHLTSVAPNDPAGVNAAAQPISNATMPREHFVQPTCRTHAGKTKSSHSPLFPEIRFEQHTLFGTFQAEWV